MTCTLAASRNHWSMLDAVLLPEGTKLTCNLCRVSTSECMDRAVIDETFAGKLW